MEPISPGKKVFSQILIAIGTALTGTAGFFLYRDGRMHTTAQSLIMVAAFGVPGLLLLAWGYEPFYRRRDAELQAGIVPEEDDDLPRL